MYPVQTNAKFNPAGNQVGQVRLAGFGFAIRPNAMAADFPRQLQLDGSNASALWGNTGWYPTTARQLNIIPATPVSGYYAAERDELWDVMVAEKESDLELRPFAGENYRFTQCIANQATTNGSAPSNGLTLARGEWSISPWTVDARAIFYGASATGTTQYVWSRINGIWTANATAMNTIEDDLILVPDGALAFVNAAGGSYDLYLTRQY